MLASITSTYCTNQLEAGNFVNLRANTYAYTLPDY